MERLSSTPAPSVAVIGATTSRIPRSFIGVHLSLQLSIVPNHRRATRTLGNGPFHRPSTTRRSCTRCRGVGERLNLPDSFAQAEVRQWVADPARVPQNPVG